MSSPMSQLRIDTFLYGATGALPMVYVWSLPRLLLDHVSIVWLSLKGHMRPPLFQNGQILDAR